MYLTLNKLSLKQIRLPTPNSTSWMHPRPKHWYLSHYVIISARGRRDVRVTKAMLDADCWTDHCLIISKLDLHIQPKRRPQGQKVTNRMNVTKLKNTEIVNDLQSVMNRKLSNLPTPSNDIEEVLASFRDTVHYTALEVLGPTTRNHQDWLEESMYYWRKSVD